MKGTYCLLIHLPREEKISVGALGMCRFLPGMYAYVGSALGGIEQRVGRHKSARKRMRWHIDYLLGKCEVLATIAIPSGYKDSECGLAMSLLSSGEATLPVPGFGSSDCRCPSHLVYFGDIEPELAAEAVSMAVTMLKTAYVRTVGDRPSGGCRRG